MTADQRHTNKYYFNGVGKLKDKWIRRGGGMTDLGAQNMFQNLTTQAKYQPGMDGGSEEAA